MKKIIVSEELCIGCGACIAIDPEHFEFSDEGLSKVKTNDNLESKALSEAIDSCPTNAISIADEACDCDEACECGDTCECENCDCETLA